jgi:hypothetical protein
MRIPAAIVVAGLLVATAILIAFHWQISATPGYLYRLDRWTGRVITCDLSLIGRIDCGTLPITK